MTDKEWVPIGGPQNDGLFRHTKTKRIKFRKYREGKGEIDRSCRTRDLSMARRRRDELMAELWGDKPLKQRRETVGEIWAAWEKGMIETKRPATADSIRYARQNLEPYAFDRFLDDMTAEWWTNEYIPKKRAEQNKRKGIDNSKRKFFNEWKWISGFLKWCERNGKAGPGWVRPHLTNPDPETDEGVVYSDPQMTELYRSATLRMATLLVMGERHFMRRDEARLLEWSRVDLENRTVRLRAQDTKTKKARTFPISSELVSLLIQIKDESRVMGLESKFVFPSLAHGPAEAMTRGEFRHLWETTYGRAGLPQGSRFHWLRHTGLTRAFMRAKLDAGRICHFAGLSLEEADRTYLHFKPDDLRGVEDLVCSHRSGEIRGFD